MNKPQDSNAENGEFLDLIEEGLPSDFFVDMDPDSGMYAVIKRQSHDGAPAETLPRLYPPADEETIRKRYGGGIYKIIVFGNNPKAQSGFGIVRRCQLRIAGAPKDPDAATGAGADPRDDLLDKDLLRLKMIMDMIKPAPAESPFAGVLGEVVKLAIPALLKHAFERTEPPRLSDSLGELKEIMGLAGALGAGDPDTGWKMAAADAIKENAPALLGTIGKIAEAVTARKVPPARIPAAGSPPAVSPGPPAAASMPAPEPAPLEENQHMVPLSATVDRVVRGFKAGEPPAAVADILAGMFPDYLDFVLQAPPEAAIDYLMQFKGMVPELGQEGAREYLAAVLEALREYGEEEEAGEVLEGGPAGDAVKVGGTD